MSDFERKSAGDAKAIQARAAEWIAERHYADKWTAADQAALDAWLGENMAHEVAYWRLDAAWDRTDRLAAMRREPRMPRTGGAQAARYLPRLIAVVALGAVIATVFLRQPAPKPSSTYTTPVGGQKTLSLSDGSKITLNTDTSLRVEMRNGERKVWLDRGEAYFEIHHDSAHPFVVLTAGHRITDLGTKFSVRNRADGLGLKVALIEGAAEIDAAGAWVSDHRAVLKPGDVAIATARTLAVSHEPVRAIGEDLTWRQGLLVFRHTTLAEAVAEFNRYNDHKLSIADPEVGELRIAGTFQSRNTALFTEAIQELFKLRVSKSGEQTIISR